MRRTLPLAILSVLLAACPAAIAQRSGAGHSGGHAGGFAGRGFHGSFSAPRSFGGFSGNAQRGFSTVPRTAPRYSAVPRYYSGFRPAYGASHRGRGHEGRRRPYRSQYRGAYTYPYYYGNAWELLPWDPGYTDFTDDDSEPSQTPEQAEPQPQNVAPPDESYRQDYAPPYETAAEPSAPPAPIAPEPGLTLIFQDGHTQTIRNYMMTPSTVIVMDQTASGRELRIPLSELDLPATERTAQQAGLDFSPPVS